MKSIILTFFDMGIQHDSESNHQKLPIVSPSNIKLLSVPELVERHSSIFVAVKLDREILKFALPNIVSNITVPLLGLVDMALMGHMDSPAYIGAIALGTVLFNVLYWSLGFLRMSTSGMTAQAYGRNDKREAGGILSKALFIALVAGLIIVIFRIPIEQLGFSLLDGSEDVKSLGRSYFSIRVWAAPASLAIFAFSGWFLGMHNAKIPMYVAIAVNVFNILFSVFFVVVLDMKSDGVALGTVISQYLGLILCIFYLFRNFRHLLPQISFKAVLPFSEFRKFLGVSRDIFIRTLCIILVFTYFTDKSAAQGDQVLAVNSLFREYLLFFSFLMDGFAYAAEPMIGARLGVDKKTPIRKVVRRIFVWGIGLTVLASIVYGAGGNIMLRALTNQHEVLEMAQPYLIYIALIPVACFMSFLWDGIYIGAVASRGMLYSILISTFLVFFPFYLLLNSYLGNHALWGAMLLFMFSRGLFLWGASKYYIFKD